MGITDNLVAKLDAFIEQMITPRALEQQTANLSLSIWGQGRKSSRDNAEEQGSGIVAGAKI